MTLRPSYPVRQLSVHFNFSIRLMTGCQIFWNSPSLSDIVNLIFSRCNTLPNSFNHISNVGGSDFQNCSSFLASSVDREMAWASYLSFTLPGSTTQNSAVRGAGGNSLLKAGKNKSNKWPQKVCNLGHCKNRWDRDPWSLICWAFHTEGWSIFEYLWQSCRREVQSVHNFELNQSMSGINRIFSIQVFHISSEISVPTSLCQSSLNLFDDGIFKFVECCKNETRHL